MKKMNLFAAMMLAAILFAILFEGVLKKSVDMGADYREITDKIDNPDRGFYLPCLMIGALEGNEAQLPEGNLVHLRVSLGAFSHNYQMHHNHTLPDVSEGGWTDLSEDFLTALTKTMAHIRQNGASAIVRFAYDDFEGIENLEPSMEGILAHISQLEPFFSENADVIAAVESGFLGRWGEQHGSVIVDENHRQKNIPTLVRALLKVVPEPITVSVRRPEYYCYVAGIPLSELPNHQAKPGDGLYRVGVYNDGYLGSESDRGTYTDREAELKWLDHQASHTLFGGEVAENYSTDGMVYNSIEHISREMFQTHTSYLNIEWNDQVIRQWKETQYQGADPVYHGLSGFTYVENHLGYRFVLRSACYSARFGKETIIAQIENVGAGNVVKPKTAVLNMVSKENGIMQIPTELDVRTWNSQNTAEIKVQIPAKLKDGVHDVYLQIADENGCQIQFANANPFSKYGNWIGEIRIGKDS